MSSSYLIDPELAEALPRLPELHLEHLDDVEAARRTLSMAAAALPEPDVTGVSYTDRKVPGTEAGSEVAVRVYVPDLPAGPIGVLDVHGGGFMFGGPDDSHAANIWLARSVGAVVVTVDYRLAPENPFPAGLEDCYAALRWFTSTGREFGVDPTRIAVHGSSAGAGLCAALALLARDRGGPSIAFQYLGIPQLDDRLMTASSAAFVDTPLWSRPGAELSWDAYLGQGVRGSDSVSLYAAPARTADLTGLPPAYISAQAYDPFRDEDIAYAQALLSAGVPVELHLFAGTFHGSTLVSKAQISRRENRERVAVLRRALGVAPL